MTDFSDIFDNVPTWKKYLTVDEQNDASKKLAEEYPETVELMDIGKSTMGESILALKIGNGKYNAFIHGFPNCEEPYGGNHLTYLSQSLAEHDEIRETLERWRNQGHPNDEEILFPTGSRPWLPPILRPRKNCLAARIAAREPHWDDAQQRVRTPFK